jgi:hypothetical protein
MNDISSLTDSAARLEILPSRSLRSCSLAQDFLDGALVESDQVFEREHFLPDGLSQFVIMFLNGNNEGLGEIAIQGIEQAGGGFDTAGLVEGSRSAAAQLLIQHLNDLFHHFHRGGGEGGQAFDHVLPEFRPEHCQ